MNAFNAVGFLALGSLMNALPALAPSLVSRGLLIGDMTTSAVWLHLMGILVGLIGCTGLGREVMIYSAALRSAAPRRAARAVEVPETAYPQDAQVATVAAS